MIGNSRLLLASFWGALVACADVDADDRPPTLEGDGLMPPVVVGAPAGDLPAASPTPNPAPPSGAGGALPASGGAAPGVGGTGSGGDFTAVGGSLPGFGGTTAAGGSTSSGGSAGNAEEPDEVEDFFDFGDF